MKNCQKGEVERFKFRTKRKYFLTGWSRFVFNVRLTFFFKYMITKVEFGLLMHIELMKEDSESRLSHNLKAKTSCDRQTNVTRLNFSTPLVGRCKLFTLLFLSVTKTEFQARNLSRQVMRIKKISVRGLIVDSITNSLN